MIEGGLAGGSAAHHADQRRSVADRLVAEAKWLEGVAEDERTTAAYLEKLSQAYAIMHDLKLAGTQGNIDHVVVGPGGAFLVVTRRFAEPLSVRDGGLFAGERALKGELDGVHSVANELSQVLGTPVAPVLGFHGTGLPVTAPQTVDGVLVCNAENLVRVITRASHTLLPPHKVTDVTEKTLPLLFNPGSVPRDQVPPRPEPVAPSSEPRVPELPVVTPPPPPPPAMTGPQAEQLSRQRDDTIRALRAATDVPAAGGPMSPDPVLLGAEAASPPVKVRHKRSKGFMLAVILSLCLVAATLGAAASMVWKDDKGAGTSSGPTTTLFVDTSATVPSLAASVPAPKVEMSAVCPSAGAGWQIVPAWPGDLTGLVQYDVEVLAANGTWQLKTSLKSAAVTAAALQAQKPNQTWKFRITAVMTDGSRSKNQEVSFTSPTSPC